MEKLTFEKIHRLRKDFLNKNENKNYEKIVNNCNFLISAPHGVSQMRKGFYKVPEPGSLSTALCLQKETNSNLIAKTKNNNDDANFDPVSDYKTEILNIANTVPIEFVIDIHGLAKKRECDINLGTAIGNNVSANKVAFDDLVDILQKGGFIVQIDAPFMGAGNTVAGYTKRMKPDLFTLQIEINCRITNYKENFEKYKNLLSCIKTWINKYIKYY